MREKRSSVAPPYLFTAPTQVLAVHWLNFLYNSAATMSRMRTRTLWIAACAAALALSGCATAPSDGQGQVTEQPATASTEQTLAGLGLTASDPEALIEGLEALPIGDRPAGFNVSVLPTEVRLQPGTPDEQSLPLAGDEFYLSLAPYQTQTHPCEFHVPTSCLGEMRAADVQLRVTDAATGEVVLEETRQTEDNGFVGIWLPRDGEFRIEATANGVSGEQVVRTGDTDPTCITTLQLQA